MFALGTLEYLKPFEVGKRSVSDAKVGFVEMGTNLEKTTHRDFADGYELYTELSPEGKQIVDAQFQSIKAKEAKGIDLDWTGQANAREIIIAQYLREKIGTEELKLRGQDRLILDHLLKEYGGEVRNQAPTDREDMAVILANGRSSRIPNSQLLDKAKTDLEQLKVYVPPSLSAPKFKEMNDALKLNGFDIIPTEDKSKGTHNIFKSKQGIN